MVTNLRIIWSSYKKQSVNLSIGLSTVTSLCIRSVDSRLRGHTRALFVLAKNPSSSKQFQFIFTNLVPDTPRLFTTVQTVHRAYETSRTYREVRLRSAAVQAGQLVLLPSEEVKLVIDGAWNLANDQVRTFSWV